MVQRKSSTTLILRAKWCWINEMLGKQMVKQGVFFGIIGIISMFFTLKHQQLIIVFMSTGLLFAGVIYSLIKGIKMMNQMAEKKG